MRKSIGFGTARKALLATLLASAGAVAPQVAFAQNAGEGATTELADIIVTAQRREERLQDVPISITAVSAEGLRERGVANLQGLQNQVCGPACKRDPVSGVIGV